MKIATLLLAAFASVSAWGAQGTSGKRDGRAPDPKRAQLIETKLQPLDQRIAKAEAMLQRLSQVTLPTPGMVLQEIVPDENDLQHRVCQAFVASNTSPCAGSMQPSECQGDYQLTRWTYSLLTKSSTYLQECTSLFANLAPHDPDGLRRFCSLAAADYTNPSKLSEDAQSMHLQLTPAHARKLIGDSDSCKEGKGHVGHGMWYCYDIAYFARAQSSGDIEQCGTSSLCRAMMGGGAKACDAYSPKSMGLPAIWAEINQMRRELRVAVTFPQADLRMKRLSVLQKRLQAVEAMLRKRL